MQRLIFGGADGLGIAHLRNMANAADPSVTRRDGGYWMVLGALDPATHVIDLFSAESALATDGWRIVTEPGDPALARRIADRRDAPRSATALVASADGIGDWQPAGAPEPDRFDTVALGDREVVARHPLNGAFTEDDGLWLVAPQSVQQILRTTDGAGWHALGAWKPTALVAGDELVVFCTTMGRSGAGPAPLFGIGCVAVPLAGLT